MRAYQWSQGCPSCDATHTTYWARPDGENAPLLEWESYNPIIRLSEHEEPPEAAVWLDVPPGDYPDFLGEASRGPS